SEVTNWMVERMVDRAARELSMDPVEIRRKNFIQPEEFPYHIPTGNMYDSGNYPGVLDKALEIADYTRLRQEQTKAREEGRYLGIGLASCQERSVFSATEFWFWFDQPAAPVTSTPESITLSMDPAGAITATLYSNAFWGNSAETMVTQLVAEQFDVEPSQITVVYSGSARSLPATGPGGSRFTVMIAGAIEGAARKIKDKMFKIAAHSLEVAPEDLQLVEGKVQVKGVPDRNLTTAQIAGLAHLMKLNLPEDVESGLEASQVYDHPYTTLPSADRKNLGVFYPFMGHACHIPVVEVDVETGEVKFLKYVAVHDCGTLVNPRTLDGHIIGGVAQGLGTALYEQYRYGPDGQLLTTTYMDYLIPTSMEVPQIQFGHQETPSPFTAYGIKGGGEGGRMMAPAAVAAAIEDALAPLGVRVTELPVTPDKLLQWIEEAKARQTQ
ncbi:MAG: xanthine dehydrogenase family protein molybdopterin-binding subunit, partial [Dehalococcoidia bacterium]